MKQKPVEADARCRSGASTSEAIEIANQEKAIAVAAKSEEQSQAQAKANQALADAVKAEQAVETTRDTAEADRDKKSR